MTKNRWVVLAALLSAVASFPALAGTVTTTMTVSVIVVAPDTPRRAEPARSDAEATPAAAATGPVAVIEDRATRTRIIVY